MQSAAVCPAEVPDSRSKQLAFMEIGTRTGSKAMICRFTEFNQKSSNL